MAASRESPAFALSFRPPLTLAPSRTLCAPRPTPVRRLRAARRTPPTGLTRPDADTKIDAPVVATQSTPPTPPTDEPDDASFSLLGSTREGQALRVAAALGSLAFAASHFTAQLSAVTHMPQTLEMPSQAALVTAVNDFVLGPHFVVALGLGLSAFIQSLTGFGFAIVGVGGLTQIPWIAHSSVFNTVQPVAATLGAITGWTLILPEINKVNFRDITPLLISSTLATPLGPLLLDFVNPSAVIRVLGALIAGFVVYSVLGVDVPKRLGGKGGAWFLGALSGTLGGAFDMTGPPLVVHAQAANWDGASGEFRRNVLTVITLNSTLVVLYDLLSGRLNDFYYYDFVLYAMPTVVAGIIAGKYLSKKMDASTFKSVVLGTCFVLGTKLLLA